MKVASPPGARLPGSVLFCCNYNRVRSAMAEGILKAHVGDAVFTDSCGAALESTDDLLAEGADPLAVEVLAERQVDLSRHRPKPLSGLEDNSFDLVVALTDEALAAAEAWARGRAIDIEFWPTADPTLSEGPRDHRLHVYREVRDGLFMRIGARFPV